MNRFEVGQKAAIERVADSRSSSGSSRWMQWPNSERGPEQAVAVVDVGVARGLRIEPARGRDLVVILGEMGLDVAVGMLAHERTRGFELRLGRGQGKARA